jgi:hypothetical protein
VDTLSEALAAITGPEHVLTDPDLTGVRHGLDPQVPRRGPVCGPPRGDRRGGRGPGQDGRAAPVPVPVPVEIAVMRAVKSAFDPAGILNPDALFPPGTG